MDIFEDLRLKSAFPKLTGTKYQKTSPTTPTYNCIAWAAGENDRQWWPDTMDISYWPPGITREVTLPLFIAAFESLGYLTCESDTLEEGFEKIAIYAEPSGRPTHAARQLPDGQWTSKLGKSQDISHELHAIENHVYGAVRAFLKRPV